MRNTPIQVKDDRGRQALDFSKRIADGQMLSILQCSIYAHGEIGSDGGTCKLGLIRYSGASCLPQRRAEGMRADLHCRPLTPPSRLGACMHFYRYAIAIKQQYQCMLRPMCMKAQAKTTGSPRLTYDAGGYHHLTQCGAMLCDHHCAGLRWQNCLSP
ncbi:hypothetical protein V8J88_05835 [Massilia sp. W12]|uniref:hypothetical protein n=1 Tax=Massilia sp. W12 TaxID=3126507 RepID=UPI0030CF9531